MFAVTSSYVRYIDKQSISNMGTFLKIDFQYDKINIRVNMVFNFTFKFQ